LLKGRKNALTAGEKSGILRAQITFTQSVLCLFLLHFVLRHKAQLATVRCPFLFWLGEPLHA
jgi:hypothetical protein